MSKYLKHITAGLLPVFFILTACQEDNPEPVSQVQEVKNEVNSHIDSWIYENMQYWYLWNDKLPASTDQNLDPEAYFKSLLSPEDRFSWIQDDYKDLLNSLQGIAKEAGYEFVLYREKRGQRQCGDADHICEACVSR